MEINKYNIDQFLKTIKTDKFISYSVAFLYGFDINIELFDRPLDFANSIIDNIDIENIEEYDNFRIKISFETDKCIINIFEHESDHNYLVGSKYVIYGITNEQYQEICSVLSQKLSKYIDQNMIIYQHIL